MVYFVVVTKFTNFSKITTQYFVAICKLLHFASKKRDENASLSIMMFYYISYLPHYEIPNWYYSNTY